ncbi:hypothetical protein SAMN04489735_100485 [Aneurinibacillus thermoaerophilus]|uniref:Uncharacterized protein n=1 Tax=Aneurinibacillus thermoaerophilus TaxID=143495 RepID=A0A1G7XN46_ANETH|nr:hypothetical protein SAMN04489735_100485 [Aneurinibacillus thermoaerophilus]
MQFRIQIYFNILNNYNLCIIYNFVFIFNANLHQYNAI